MHRQNEEVPYRSPISALTPPSEPAFSQDEQDFSTLQAVRKVLAAAVADLKSDFNVIDLNLEKLATDLVASQSLLRQIGIKQGVYEIVAPLLEAVDAAMEFANKQHNQRNSR